MGCGKLLGGIVPPSKDLPWGGGNLVHQEPTRGRFTSWDGVFDPEVPAGASHGVGHADVNGNGRDDMVIVPQDGPSQLRPSNLKDEQPRHARMNMQTNLAAPAVSLRIRIQKIGCTSKGTVIAQELLGARTSHGQNHEIFMNQRQNYLSEVVRLSNSFNTALWLTTDCNSSS